MSTMGNFGATNTDIASFSGHNPASPVLGITLCLIKKPLVIQPLDAEGNLRTKKYPKSVVNQQKWQPLMDFLYSIKSMA